MTYLEFVQYVRKQTRTDSTILTDEDIVLSVNAHIEKLSMDLAEADEDYLGQVATADLLLNTREYPLPTDLLSKIKYVEAKLDGTKWVKMTELDLNSYDRTTDEDSIIANFGNTEGRAFYDIFRNSLWLYSGSVIAVEEGLKLWFTQYPYKWTTDDLDSTTDISVDPSTTSSGFPRQLHLLLATAVIIDWKEGREEPIPLTKREQNLEIDLAKAIRSIKRMNRDRNIVAKLPDTRIHEGNNGYNF